MNRTASIRLKGINYFEIKDNLPFIILLSLSLLSILLGVLTLNNENLSIFATKLFENYVSARNNKNILNAFSGIIMQSLKFPVYSFLCGTSVLGLAISPIFLCYVSFCYGSLVGHIYISYGISGIVFNLFVLILPSIILIMCLIISVKDCISFSKMIAKSCIRESRPVNLYNEFKFFCLKHLVLLIPVVLSAILDASLFSVFERYLDI